MLIILTTIGVVLFDYRDSRLFTYILVIPTLLVPLVFRKSKIIYSDLDVLIYYIFIFIAQVLGCICNLYNVIWYFDLVVHFVSGLFSFYIGLIIIKNFNLECSLFFKIFFCICFCGLIAVLWEIFEFSGDCLFNLNIQHNRSTGVFDTMEDMIMAIIGSLVYAFGFYIKYNNKNK